MTPKVKMVIIFSSPTMEALFAYSLSLFLFFYLLNYAEITAIYARGLKDWLGPVYGYPASCAFCWGFWTTLFSCLVGAVPVWFVFTAPVIHLFIDLSYTKLGGHNPADDEYLATWAMTK